MGKYLIQVNYSAAGMQGLMKEGAASRVAYVTGVIEAAGGTVESFNFAFGDRDAYVVFDAPDEAAVTGLTLAVGASGAVSLSTVKLLTAAEVDAGIARAASYRPPGS
jgi:uncharacterized protein with GYD domain